MPEAARPVWLRRTAMTKRCPKSVITAESAAWLDEFFTWKVGGPGSLLDLPARKADAFLVLEREWRMELKNGE